MKVCTSFLLHVSVCYVSYWAHGMLIIPDANLSASVCDTLLAVHAVHLRLRTQLIIRGCAGNTFLTARHAF